MREVVNDGDAVHHRAHFQPALHALETGDRFLDCRCAQSLACGQRRGGGCIQRVVLACHLHFHPAPQSAAIPYLPTRQAFCIAQITNLPVRLIAEAIPLDAAECLLHALGDVCTAIECDDAPAPRHQIHEPLEGGLYRVEIRVDVRMIEFDVGQDERIGKVVQELRPLVKKCRVVFVAFEDECARRP